MGAAAQELQRLRECHAAEVAALRREAEAERARLVAAHEADWEQVCKEGVGRWSSGGAEKNHSKNRHQKTFALFGQKFDRIA